MTELVVSVVLGLLRMMRAFQLMVFRHFNKPGLLSWALSVEGGSGAGRCQQPFPK
jgi:hypothetical protein